jgi:hypothetical protein
MKTFLSGYIMMVLIVVFSSCQKEVEGTIINENLTDSIISRITILDTAFSSGVDTAQTIDFTYDVSKRLSKFKSIYYNLGVSGTGRFDTEEEYVYEYTGAGQFPGKLLAKYTDFAGSSADYDTSFLTYTDGYISRDSFTSSIGFYQYRVAAYNKLSSNRYKVYHKTDNGAGGQIIDTSYVNLSWQNGNLVKEIDSLWLPGGTWSVASMTVTYDSKPNPFKSFSLPIPAPLYQHNPGNIAIPEFSVQSENNMTSQTNARGVVELSLSYQYGSTGLPKIVRDGSTRKYFYFYKKL